MHRARSGGGRATSDASRRRFWAMAARTNSSWAPRGPRSRSRPSFRIRFKCANRISIFLRSRRDFSKSSVPANDRATSRACSWMSRGILRDGSLDSTAVWAGIHRSRACSHDTEASCPRAPCHSSRAAFRLGSGRRHRSGHIESHCARRCHHLASTCRTPGYVARCPSPQPACSASEQPRKRYPRQAAPA
jgi:hypothetical protein